MSTAVLEVDSLARAFGGVRAVDDVSFALHPVRSSDSSGRTAQARRRSSTS